MCNWEIHSGSDWCLKAQYFSSGCLSTFKFSLGYTSFSDQSLFWHLYIRTVSYVYLWMVVMEFLITSLQPMGSKASALLTWDGQGQSLSSKRWDSTINPTMESMPCRWPAYMHTFCRRSHFQRSERYRGQQHTRLEHICPHRAAIQSLSPRNYNYTGWFSLSYTSKGEHMAE